MPVDWVHNHIEAILWMSLVLRAIKVLSSGDAINSKHEGEAFNLFCVWIFGNAYKVLVKQLHTIKVRLDLVLILADTASDSGMLEQLEDELILVLVLMDCLPGINILELLPEKNLSEFVSKIDLFELLFHVHSDSSVICAHPSFMENVKERHVKDIAVQLSVLYISDLSTFHSI